MILDLCGGEASEPRISGEFPADGYPNRDNVVAYRPQRLADLGGIELAPSEQAAILGRLEFLRLDPDDPESWVNEAQRLRWPSARQRRRDLAGARADLAAATSTARPTSSRRSRASTATSMSPSTPLERAAGGRPADRHAGAADRAAACAARRPRAGSTRRSPGASFPRRKRRRSAAATGGWPTRSAKR